MMDTSYSKASKKIVSGFIEIAYCLYRSVSTHKLLTALIISVIGNIMLVLAVMARSANYHHANSEIVLLEQKYDSVTNADVRYLPLTKKDFDKVYENE